MPHTHSAHHRGKHPKQRYHFLGQRLSRTTKNLIHFGLLILIIISLFIEGGGATDIGFVALAVVTELS